MKSLLTRLRVHTLGLARVLPQKAPETGMVHETRQRTGQQKLAPTPRQNEHDAVRQIATRAFAPDALLHAWRKVRANGGGPGIDGEDLRKFEARLQPNLASLRAELLSGSYRPLPVWRVSIPKPNGGRRPISILAVRDRIAQRAAHDALAPLFEPHFLPCSFGFREGRSIHDAVAAVICHRDAGLRHVVDGDISRCFEHINHDLLMQFVARSINDKLMLSLIRKWLKARVFNDMPNAAEAESDVGALQGSAMSPLLSNIYLHQFDVALTNSSSATPTTALVRYADDWLILCRREVDAKRALIDATHALSQLHLNVNPHRTRIASFDAGFAFLGAFFIRDEHYWISPSSRSSRPVTGERLTR